MNQVINKSITNLFNVHEKSITDNARINKNQISKGDLLNNYSNRILYLSEKRNHYGICKSDDSDTFYLFKRDNTELKKDIALRFIDNYFDIFIYFFNQKGINSFFEYTAQLNSDKDVVIIKTFKEKKNAKIYQKKKESI